MDHHLGNDNAILLPNTSSLHKNTLLLDLDETLVQVLPSEELHLTAATSTSEEAFSFEMYRGTSQHRRYTVFKRRGLADFLEFASSNFEVVLFTAAKQEYAEKILAVLDPKGKYFSHSLFRQHCIRTGAGKSGILKSIKQLSNRNQANCILVDDNESNFRANEGNCIRISPMDIADPEEDDEL